MIRGLTQGGRADEEVSAQRGVVPPGVHFSQMFKEAQPIRYGES